jgi:hypothetical protein
MKEKIDEDALKEYFYDWMTGDLKRDRGTKWEKFNRKIEKELRKEANRAYPLLAFVLDHFDSLEKEYKAVISQVQSTGLDNPNLPVHISWDYHSGYMMLGRQFVEIFAEKMPLYEEGE